MPGANQSTFTQEDANFNREATAGYGSAVILPKAPVDKTDALLRAQKSKEDQQKRLQKAKAGKEFYDNIEDIQKKIHPSDIKFFQDQVGGLMDWMKTENRAGNDPLDAENPSYPDLLKKLSDIKVMAGASYSQFQQKLQTEKEAEGKPDDYNLEGTYDSHKKLDAIGNPIDRADPEKGGNYTAVQNPFDPFKFIKKSGVLDEEDKIAAIKMKPATTPEQQQENQDALDAIKQQAAPKIDWYLSNSGKYKDPNEMAQARDAILSKYDNLAAGYNRIPKEKMDQQAGQFKKNMDLKWWVATHKAGNDELRTAAYEKKVQHDTQVQDYGTPELLDALASNTPEGDMVFNNEIVSAANQLGLADKVAVKKGEGKELYVTYPENTSDGKVQSKTILFRDKNGNFDKEAAAGSSVIKLYETAQKQTGTSPTMDATEEDKNSNVKEGTKISTGKSITKSSTEKEKTATPTVKKKGSAKAYGL